MTIRIGELIHSFESRVQGDVLSGRAGVVIPLNQAAVCAEDHVYDVREFRVCPNCASEERLPLSHVLAHRPPAAAAMP